MALLMRPQGHLHAVAETKRRQNGDPSLKQKATKQQDVPVRFSFPLSTRHLQARVPIWSAERGGQGYRFATFSSPPNAV